MLRPRATTRFREDLKGHLRSDLEAFLQGAEVMGRIVRVERLGPEHNPHKLAGSDADCWECHPVRTCS